MTPRRAGARGLGTGLLAAVLAAGVPLPGTGRDFGFQGLEILRFRDATRQLSLQDLDGSGRDGILFINNRQSRIEILLARPAGEGDGPGPRFENRGMILDQQITSYAAGDLDGDGRPDLLTFGSALGLQMHRQAEDGSFEPPVAIHVRNPSEVVSLRVADLDGNGRADIVLGRRDHATVLWNDPREPFLRKDRLDFADDSGAGVEAIDLLGDGRPDLLFRFQQGIPFRIRLNEGGGRFGVETPLPLPPMRHLQAYTDPRFGARIAGVLRDGVNFRVYELAHEPLEDLFRAQELRPGRIPLPGEGLKHDGAWIVLDLDGDGRDDLVAALPDRSQLAIFRGGPRGLEATPEILDTLSEVGEVSASADGDLLVVSRRERVAALHGHGRLDRFPSLLRAPGPVFAGRLLPSGERRALLVCRLPNQDMALAEWSDDGGILRTHPLDLAVEPTGMRLFDWGEGGLGVLLFVPHSAPKFYRLLDGEVQGLDAAAFRAALQPLRPDHLTVPGPAGCGRRVLAAEGRAARFYEWTGEEFEIIRQFNPGLSQAQIVSACPFEGRGGRRGHFAYDAASSDLVWFEGDSAEPVRIHLQHASPEIAAIRQLRHPELDILLLVGRRDLLQVASPSAVLAARARAEYTSASENPGLRFFRPVALGSPPRPLLALVDPANRTVELVSEGEEGLERELAFEVFQDAGFAAPGRRQEPSEPRDVASGDFNGDGAGDLVFLVHENLLLYPGAPAPCETAAEPASGGP